MARSRLLKPGFFTNEDLASVSIEARLLFAGLWTVADREGRLEDRPLRIKAELFPYDSVDVNALLGELASVGVITRYTHLGAAYVAIPNFLKHQKPHHREQESNIPAPEAAPRQGEPAMEVESTEESRAVSVSVTGNGSDPVSVSETVEVLDAPADKRRTRKRLITEQDIEALQVERPDVDMAAFVADQLNWVGSSKYIDQVQWIRNQLRVDWKVKPFLRSQAKPGYAAGPRMETFEERKANFGASIVRARE